MFHETETVIANGKISGVWCPDCEIQFENQQAAELHHRKLERVAMAEAEAERIQAETIENCKRHGVHQPIVVRWEYMYDENVAALVIDYKYAAKTWCPTCSQYQDLRR